MVVGWLPCEFWTWLWPESADVVCRYTAIPIYNDAILNKICVS